MTTTHVFLLVFLAAIGFMVLGAHLWHQVVGTPSDRELALKAKIDAMKRANYLGAEFFQAQGELREEMAEAARQRPPRSRGRARASNAPGDPTVIDGDWLA